MKLNETVSVGKGKNLEILEDLFMSLLGGLTIIIVAGLVFLVWLRFSKYELDVHLVEKETDDGEDW